MNAIEKGLVTMAMAMTCGFARAAEKSPFGSMQWFNEPVKVGPVAAAPDGKGFRAEFSNFEVKHLPDARRLEWLKANGQ